MRALMGPTCLLTLLCSACTAPAPEPDQLPPSALAVAEPTLEFHHAPEAPEQRGPPPGFVGPNPGCPDLRVFADAEDLCTRGIMPLDPNGGCARMRKTGESCDGFCSEIEADRVGVPALSGRAELFVHHFVNTTGNDSDSVYLALRGTNGYVLLDAFAWYSPQTNDPPEFERLVGRDTSVEIRVRQRSHHGGGERTERSKHRCARDEDGGIRCQGECPDLALDVSVPELDCDALASFDWSTLPRSRRIDLEEDWGSPWEDDMVDDAAKFLGLDDVNTYEPADVREVEVEGQRGKVTLNVIAPKRGRWALIEDTVPLLASRREIRVGPGPGGTFVTSGSRRELRVHRLHIDTHELEPVLPGACGEP